MEVNKIFDARHDCGMYSGTTRCTQSGLDGTQKYHELSKCKNRVVQL